jgi:hypothetical protein
MHTKSRSTGLIDNDSDKGNTCRLQDDDVMYVEQGALILKDISYLNSVGNCNELITKSLNNKFIIIANLKP